MFGVGIPVGKNSKMFLARWDGQELQLPVPLPTSSNAPFAFTGPARALDALPDGTVAMALWICEDLGCNESWIELLASLDGGVSFSPPVVITQWGDPAFGLKGAHPALALAADRTIHALYQGPYKDLSTRIFYVAARYE